MILFKNVEYKNFLSAGNTPIKIQLDSHSLTLITGKNGCGKSTVIEAITFALFGKPFRPFNKPQLINSINQKHCVTTIEFEIGKKQYKVIRGIKPNLFEIYENDKLVNQDPSVRDYQKVLEQQILKMNYRAFTQVVIMGSSSYVPFMRLKASERREFIEDLLDIRIFSVMNVLLKDKIKGMKENISTIDVEIKSLREKIALQDKHVKSRKKEKQLSIDALTSEIDNLISINDDYQSAISKLMSKVTILTDQSKKFESASEQLTELRTIHKRIESNIRKHNEEKQLFHNIEECPVCHQSVHDDHRENIVGSVDRKIQELQDDLGQLQVQLEKVNSDLAKYEEFTLKIAELNSSITTHNKSIIANNAKIEDKKHQVVVISNDTTNIDEETNVLRDYAKTAISRSNLKKELLETQQYQTTASVLLQDTGIKAKIIKQYIPIINKLINKYLDAMDLFVGFNLDENFNEVIKSRYRDTFSYESFSDGQKRRIDAALLLTWRDVAKSKNSVNTNLIFFDEFDSPLDGGGADMLMELYKASNIQNVFVISHKEGLSNAADRVVEFEVHNNFTELKEV